MGNSQRYERQRRAIIHTDRMENQYSREIAKSIEGTRMYDGYKSGETVIRDTEIIIEELDTVSVAYKYSWEYGGKVATLNFASFNNPGGGFIGGSKAQEECLCHESFLYNVLVEFKDFYEWNKRHTNRSLYMDRGLYSPDVLFFKGRSIFPCDVITCSAPNKSAAQKYSGVSDGENSKALKSRIKLVLEMAKDGGANTLILGAFGCGVFGQNPYEVATIFKKYLEGEYKCFDRVVFAIPRGRGSNVDKFRKVLEG